MTRAEAIRKIGGAPDRTMEAVRPKGAHHAPIGVVEGIVAIARYTATITGVANHAWTTPMAEQQDALIADHAHDHRDRPTQSQSSGPGVV